LNTQWQVSSKSITPKWLYQLFFDFFDPCPVNPIFDGLAIPWKIANYVNPPFDDKVPWIKKAIEEMDKGNTTVMLLPVDTRAAWYHDLVITNAEILTFRGNFNLDNGKHTRYGVMLAIFHPTLERQSRD
jgi:hypothetical protein